VSDTRAGQSVPVGIFAKTFAGTTPLEVLTQARDAGYDVVQYNMACSGLPSLPLEVAQVHVDAMRAAIDATRVQIVALSATANLIHPDTQVREAGLQSVAVLACVAKQLGIPVLTLCSGSRNAADQWAAHKDNVSAAH
jgi:sugar phosphate isomerase/epimerase